MRSHVVAAITGALGLAAQVVAAPAGAVKFGGLESCANEATVTVTVPQAITVTVHDTVVLNSSPTLTSTRVTILHSTSTFYAAPSTETLSLSLASQVHDVTVYATEVITITNVLGASSSEAGPSTIPLAFMVDGGITYWLNGQTPASAESYVIATSVVTVQPINTPIPVESETSTSTLTMFTTLWSTSALTVTATLPRVNNTSAQATSIPGSVSSSARPSWVGWNTSSAAGVVASSVYNQATIGSASSSISFITEESTLDIYHPETTVYTLSSYGAQSGFNVPFSHTTAPATTSAPVLGSSTSSALGVWTTAVIDGQTVSWGGPGRQVSSVLTNDPSVTSFSTVATPEGTAVLSINWSSVTSFSLGIPPSETSVDGINWSTVSSFSMIAPPSETSVDGINWSSVSSFSMIAPPPSFTSFSTIAPPSFNNAISSSFSKIAPESTVTSDFGNISETATRFASLPTAPLTFSYPTTTLSSSLSVLTASSSLLSSNSNNGVASTYAQLSTPSATSQQSTTFVTSMQSAVPSSCGQQGDFVMNFDDMPPLSVTNSSDQSIQPEPIFSPYHKFDFSNGFAAAPPPTDPYTPSSAPLLAEFIPNFNTTTPTPQSRPNNAEDGWSGDIGNADHGVTTCFNFNVYGASFGCGSTGPDCDFSFTGYKYSGAIGTSQNPTVIASKTVSIPACPGQVDCALIPITLDPSFMNLDVIRINVTVAGQPKMWWMDDLRMGWTDNSCAKGLCRAAARIRTSSHLQVKGN